MLMFEKCVVCGKLKLWLFVIPATSKEKDTRVICHKCAIKQNASLHTSVHMVFREHFENDHGYSFDENGNRIFDK